MGTLILRLQIDLQVFFVMNHVEHIAMGHNRDYNINDDRRPTQETFLTQMSTWLPTMHWGIEYQVDPIELHKSKKPALYRDNFDPKESKPLSMIILKLFPSKGLQLVLFEKTKMYIEKDMMWWELL